MEFLHCLHCRQLRAWPFGYPEPTEPKCWSCILLEARAEKRQSLWERLISYLFGTR